MEKENEEQEWKVWDQGVNNEGRPYIFIIKPQKNTDVISVSQLKKWTGGDTIEMSVTVNGKS